MQLEPLAEAEPLGPLAVARSEVAHEPHDRVGEVGARERGQERARVALAEHRAGVSDAEAAVRPVLEPREVVEVGAVRDDRHFALRPERAEFLGDEVRDGDRLVGVARDQPRNRFLRAFLRPRREPLDGTVGVSHHRVAHVGDPLDAGEALHRGTDQVHRVRRRGRDDDVDPLGAHDLDRRRDRGRVPRHVFVGDEHAAIREERHLRGAFEPARAVELLGRPPTFRPDVARAVHPGLRRRDQLVVAVDPLRVVGREHVRLDPERRQVRRELQRSLNARAAGRRPVHRDEQDFHLELRSARTACTTAGLGSRHDHVASTKGGRGTTGRSPGISRIAHFRRPPFIRTASTASPVRSR